jgi:acetyl-CoA carboxylase carboxyltransferase component
MSQEKLRATLAEHDARALAGGSAKARERHQAQGKILVRDRLRKLFDEGVLFEDGLLAGGKRDLPADAVVTCVGRIHGREVAVIANDITVKAGTWGYTTFLKITQMQELALRSKMPLIYLVDSAGARIDDQFDCYLGRKAWGNIFYNQVQISGVIPQICVMFGPSPAGSAYVPALCDVTFMVDKNATAYLGSPRLAKMATGEDVTEEQMGGARMHCAMSGLGDLLVQTEDDAISKAREYLAFFPDHFEAPIPIQVACAPEQGAKPSEIVPPNQNAAYDVRKLIRSLVDENSFFELKELFAKELCTGLARLGGRPVGIVANNSANKGGVLFNDSSDKGARFIWTCNAFNIPLLFLQDISGFMIGSAVERAGIIRHGAKLLTAVCEAKVARISVMVRKGYGGGYLAMSGAPTQPDAQLALPGAMPALMGPEAAVNAVHLNEIMALPEDQRAAFIQAKREEYGQEINPYDPADRFSFEAVIDPDRLRDELIRRFDIYCRRAIPRINRRNGVSPV